MVQYLLESYQDQSTLAIVGAKRDLEGCTMKSYENPKGLFEKLTAVQVKYTGNPMVTISESDLVTQAIQALPAEYTSSVASLVDSGRALTIAELKKVVFNYHSLATKGKKIVARPREIEGGLATVDEVDKDKEKDNLKRLIQETINTTIREYHIKYQPSQGLGGAGGFGMMSMVQPSTNQAAAGLGINGGYGANSSGQPSVPSTAMGSSSGLTAEMILALLQNVKEKEQAPAPQIDMSTMLCYNCGQFGHRSSDCKNARNVELATQVLLAQGRKPCEHCGRFGHPPALCWTLPANAQLRPDNWRPPVKKVEVLATNGVTGVESGSVAMDGDGDSGSELSLAMKNLDQGELESMDASLRAMGLNLSNPDVWIGDTGATTHNTAYIEGAVNLRDASAQDDIVGVTGPPAKAKTIIDIPCEIVRDGVKENIIMKDVTYVPNSRYNLFSLTKLISNGWAMSGDKDVGIRMTKGDKVLLIDKTVHTPKGMLYVVVMKRRRGSDGVMMNGSEQGDGQSTEADDEVGAAVAPGQSKPITISKAHAMCGHMGQVEARAVCEHFGQAICKQGFQKCGSCSRAKAKQLPVSQENEVHEVAGPEGHRLFIDISSVKHGPEAICVEAVLAVDGGGEVQL